MKEDTLIRIISTIVVILVILVIYAVLWYSEMQQYAENDCVKKNVNTDGSYNYNKIIKCCQDEANLNPSYCLSKYKPGYEEKK